jgi:hypothetical protein
MNAQEITGLGAAAVSARKHFDGASSPDTQDHIVFSLVVLVLAFMLVLVLVFMVVVVLVFLVSMVLVSGVDGVGLSDFDGVGIDGCDGVNGPEVLMSFAVGYMWR